MCEFLERMRLTGTPTEEVRKWSGMTHRVVELTGPFPTPDEMRVELWLHEESATRLLDMCDWIDAEFHKVQAENANLREQVTQLKSEWESERDYADQMEAKEKRAVGENDKLREIVDGLTWCCEHYSCRQECPLYDVSEPDHCREVSIKRELGIEVEDD